MEWNWIDRLCVIFYYAIGPIAILWLATIVHTILFY